MPICNYILVLGAPGLYLRGYSWEFLVGGVPPGSLNPDPISDQKP